jgi:PKD domain
MRVGLLALVAAIALTVSPVALAANPVQIENAKPGDSYWMAATQDSASSAIEGYTTATSVRPGDSIGFRVSTSPAARYRIEIDRLGWYDGSGGRRVTCLVRARLDAGCSQDELGVQQPAAPALDPVTGKVDAAWSVTDTLSVPADWTSGYYLAVFRLTSGPSAGQTGFTPFVVQAPLGNHAAILVQVPANTWQAYNTWGGEDLYTNPRAVKVSFNRPYALEGAAAVGAGRGGGLFEWEYPLVRFLERGGWDVSYATDDDVDRDPRILLNHALDMTAGHDEYWTKQMRDAWETAQAAGVNLAFMGANTGYWQIRYEDNDRTIVSYKNSPDPDPDPADKTVQFRQLAVPRPECQLEGVQFAGTVLYRDYLDYSVDIGDPWFVGSGLTPGSVLQGLVGYETDAIDPTCHVPPVTPLLSYSSSPGDPGNQADAVRYTACSGAEVFSAGSLQFSWGLDSWRDPSYSAPGFPPLPSASSGLQQAMTQALEDLTRSHVALPGPPEICVPTSAFTTSVSQPATGQTVGFTSTATDASGQLASEGWDLTGSGRFQDATGPAAARSFPSPGLYRVGLRVADASGASSTTAKTLLVCRCPAASRLGPPTWPAVGWNASACNGADFGRIAVVKGRLRFERDPGIGRFTTRLYSLALGARGVTRRKLIWMHTVPTAAPLALRGTRAPAEIELSTQVGGALIKQQYLLAPRRGNRLVAPSALDATVCDGTAARVLTPLFGGPRSSALRLAVTGRGREFVTVARRGRPVLYHRSLVGRGQVKVLRFGAVRVPRGSYEVTISCWLGRIRERIVLVALRM